MSVKDLSKKWDTVSKTLTTKFGQGEKLDLAGILFLIGVQELGQGNVKFNKSQKVELMHIAICSLLSTYGYYDYLGVDKDGWPHYKLNKKLPPLSVGQQNFLLKEAIISYFEKGIVN